MTEEDKYALREFLRGVGVFLGASAVFIIILIVLAHFATGGKPLESFEVVDKYDNRCNVIRYTPNNSARYVYFLDCEKNK